MKLLALTITLFLTIGSAEEWYEANNPHFLNKETFQTAIQADQQTYKIVKFFTPTCKYCRYLKNEFEELKKVDSWQGITFYDINCYDNYYFCLELIQITSFPHVVIYNKFGVAEEQVHGYYASEVFLQVFQNTKVKSSQQIVPIVPTTCSNEIEKTLDCSTENKYKIAPIDTSKEQTPQMKEKIIQNSKSKNEDTNRNKKEEISNLQFSSLYEKAFKLLSVVVVLGFIIKYKDIWLEETSNQKKSGDLQFKRVIDLSMKKEKGQLITAKDQEKCYLKYEEICSEIL